MGTISGMAAPMAGWKNAPRIPNINVTTKRQMSITWVDAGVKKNNRARMMMMYGLALLTSSLVHDYLTMVILPVMGGSSLFRSII